MVIDSIIRIPETRLPSQMQLSEHKLSDCNVSLEWVKFCPCDSQCYATKGSMMPRLNKGKQRGLKLLKLEMKVNIATNFTEIKKD